MGATAAGVTGGNPVPMTAAARVVLTNVNEQRLAEYVSSLIAIGGSENFVITADLEGAAIPDLIYISGVIIVPSALSTYRVRLFAKGTRRAADPMMYEWPFGPDLIYTNDVTGFWLQNLDASNRIIGTIEVDAVSANAASLEISVFYQLRRPRP